MLNNTYSTMQVMYIVYIIAYVFQFALYLSPCRWAFSIYLRMIYSVSLIVSQLQKILQYVVCVSRRVLIYITFVEVHIFM